MPLNYGLIAATRALIVVRYHLDQNDMRTKSYRGGKSSVILEGAMIFLPSMCRSFNDFLVVKISEEIIKN